MSIIEKIDIEGKENDNINNIDINNIEFNQENNYKLEFNFDLLNEPMPDFTYQKNILKNKNNVYKRKYNEIKNSEYSHPGESTLKLK